MIIEIQCAPKPSGTEHEPYAHIHAAIDVIARSGLTYEVGALGTTVEGEPDALWLLMRAVHEATLEAGATSSQSTIKVFEQRVDQPVSMASLTDRYRE